MAGAALAAWIGVGRRTEATRQRAAVAAHEEWFRRLQWAADLALSDDEWTRVAGLAMLQALAVSALAGPAELDLLFAGDGSHCSGLIPEPLSASAWRRLVPTTSARRRS